MALLHTRGVGGSVRALTFALLPIVGALAIAGAQSPRAGTGEVIAVRELQLKAGTSEAAFERFVVDTYNPQLEGVVPGMKGFIAKADRGAQKGTYALFFVFDSARTRDAIFPKEGGGASDRFAEAVNEAIRLNTQLEKFIEPGTLSVYTDYVALR